MKLGDLTSSGNDETARIEEEQVQHLGTEIGVLDTIVNRIQEQNDTEQTAREESFSALASTAHNSWGNISKSMSASSGRFRGLGKNVAEQTDELRESLHRLDKDADICTQLAALRLHDKPEEHIPTGQTPDAQGVQLLNSGAAIEHIEFGQYIHTGQMPTRGEYSDPIAVPQTSDRDEFMERTRAGPAGDAPSSQAPILGQQLENGSVIGQGTADGETLLNQPVFSNRTFVALDDEWAARNPGGPRFVDAEQINASGWEEPRSGWGEAGGTGFERARGAWGNASIVEEAEEAEEPL
ncbi:Kinesin- motor protein [Kalmusia sp. IMI 367209]|nr:Kinesin- motor protein [Kalmusia sp. IMI 367209]